MGTSYNIKYINGDEFPESKEIHTEIDRLLEEVNDQMSTYREDSELAVLFNQHKGADAFGSLSKLRL
ncbi:FAD:protein FMN transferase [Vibrio lentus]|nr:FAD:protein FMN transferase [Vibrio lentus]